MARLCVLNGQISGTVDWVSSCGREAGVYLKQGSMNQVKTVLVGSAVEQLLSNGKILKGQEFIASGELSARARVGADGAVISELVCFASHLAIEAPRANRSPGYGLGMFRGIINYWAAPRTMLKSFINSNTPGAAPTVTLTISLTKWLNGMSPESQAAILAKFAACRDYAAAGTLAAGGYIDKNGVLVPALTLYAGEFHLL